MSQDFLRSLGTTYGYFQSTPTTYADRGVLNSTRPAWQAWREVTPIASGLIAGSLAFLLDPYIVAAIQSGVINVSLPEYLKGLWSTNVAMIFGDNATFGNIRQLQERHTQLCVLPDQLPDWYKPFGRRPIDFADERMRFAMMTTLLGAVADAHVATGLTNHAEAGTEYMQDLQATVATANGLLLPSEGPGGTMILRTVTAGASNYMRQPQLTRREAYAANVLGQRGIFQKLMDADLGGGFTVRSFYPQFGGLIPERVRELLELRWVQSDQRRWDDWAGSYADKVAQTPNRPTDWFDVAVRTRGR